MHLPGENEWSLGHVIGEKGPRSFRVVVNGKHYRHNRRWLRATLEELEPTVTIQHLTEPGYEPEETISPDVSLPTMPVSVEVPEPSTASRPVRECRPPAWLKDYECEHLHFALEGFFTLNRSLQRSFALEVKIISHWKFSCCVALYKKQN